MNLILIVLAISVVFVVACGGAAKPVEEPAVKSAPVVKEQPVVPTPVAKAVDIPSDSPKTAKDKAIAVIAIEPEHLAGIRSIDAHGGQLLDTISAYIGHVDRNTLKVAPSSLMQGWKQIAPDQWEYDL